MMINGRTFTYHHRRCRNNYINIKHLQRRLLLLLVLSLSSSLYLQSCQAQHHSPIISLTDKTFDNVREAFTYPSMLILAHSTSTTTTTTTTKTTKTTTKTNNNRHHDKIILEEFHKLSNDELIKDKDIMLVTIDVGVNRMLAARMGVPMNSDLPSLIYLYSEHLFHHQGQIPTSALLMRSYALQGYQNQGSGEPLVAASYWLLLKTIYMNWLFNDTTVAGRNVNVMALVLSGVVVGLILCGLIALVVLWKYSTDVFDDEKGIRSNGNINMKRKKS